jgi:hypothetical protein
MPASTIVSGRELQALRGMALAHLPDPTGEHRSAAIERFRDVLLKGGVIATIRRTRGDDIDAACGQLVGRVNDRTTVRLGQKMLNVAVVQA